MATAEMHAAKAVAPASAMTSAEMSATAVTAAAVTATAASRQRRTRQHGRDNQNGNSNAGLRHVICSGLIYSNDAGMNRKFPAPKSAQGQSRHFHRAPLTSGLPQLADILRGIRHVSKVPIADKMLMRHGSDPDQSISDRRHHQTGMNSRRLIRSPHPHDRAASEVSSA
jgi:hypothetical protein